MNKVFLDYEEIDSRGTKKRVQGRFEFVKETENFIRVKSGKNIISINWKDVHKHKVQTNERRFN